MKIRLMRRRKRANELLHQRQPHEIALFLAHIMVDHTLLCHCRVARFDRVEQPLVERHYIINVGVQML